MRKIGEIFVPQIEIRGNFLLLCIFCNSDLSLSKLLRSSKDNILACHRCLDAWNQAREIVLSGTTDDCMRMLIMLAVTSLRLSICLLVTSDRLADTATRLRGTCLLNLCIDRNTIAFDGTPASVPTIV